MALFGIGGSSKASQATVDPEFEQQVKVQQQRAKEFRAGLPNLQSQQQTQIKEGARQDLVSRMADIKTGANQRGMLFSGLKQAQQGAAGSMAAGNVANQSAAINNRIQDQASQMDQTAIQGGLSLQQAKQEAANQNFQNDSEAYKKKGITGLLGTVGAVTGGALGGSK
jgi:hypothetical protein